MRATYFGLAGLIVFSVAAQIVNVILVDKNYKLSPQARLVVGNSSPYHAESLKYDAQTSAYQYNQGYEPGIDIAGNTSQPKFSASFYKDPTKGVQVDDPYSKTSLTFKPKFQLAPPKQIDNRLLYPIKGQNAVKVYTLQAIGFKEDIVLNAKSKDSLEYKYTLELAPGTEARLEHDGSVGVYGASQELLGNVSTGSDKDAELLDKARKNAKKTKLLYKIPAPEVREYNNKNTAVKTWFTLKDSELTVHATNLHSASYPLSIDPSIYIDTAAKLMRGNNETNIDFDINQELIQKGSTTGARFDSLTADTDTDLDSVRWNHGTAVAGGYVYTVGGNNGSSNLATVHWAKFDSTTYEIDSTNPGEGVCTEWCTNSAYDLPAARAGLSLVAYNGFLYAIGGNDSSCTSGNGTGDNQICDTVYVAKLGTNGEPSLWHPSDPDKPDWVYWYRASDLSTEREYTAAVAYNNRMYLVGGRTYSGGASAVDTVERAEIIPNGDLGSWTTSTDLSGADGAGGARFGHSAQIYNDYLYLIGGNISGTLQDRVDYININSDGSLDSDWIDANAFTTARQGWGGNFSTIWGGYLYVGGGCAAIDAEGECTGTGITNGGSIEIASINADGSLSSWSTISGVTNSRIGYGFVSWRNTVYSIGGCTAQNTTTAACTTTTTDVKYGLINPDGDISTVTDSVASGAGDCTGGDPFNCSLPTVGDDSGEIGHMLSATAIMNGYMYIIGGCGDISTTTECNAGDAFSSNTAYAAVSSDGSLRKPPSCVGSFVDSWCVDNVNTINGTDGVGAAGITVFEGRIYVIGGLDNTATGTQAVFSTLIDDDGSLTGGWVEQSFTDLGITGSGELAYTFAYARANPSAAGTYPGNIYIFGGCGTVNTGVECDSSDYRSEVWKCNIENTTGRVEDADANDCDTTGQLQIDTEGGGGNQGLGLHSGAVYANYIYLIGGDSSSTANRNTVFYAKFDNSNNVVAVSGSAWTLSSSTLNTGRGWGQSFGYNGYLYVVGGYSGSSSIGTIEFAKFNVGSGDIEAFETSNVSLSQRWGQGVVVSNSYAYVIGGCSTGSAPAGCTAFRTASIEQFHIYNNDSGTPAGYSTATGVSMIAEDRFGAGSAIYNGYIYIAGGCVGSSDCNDASRNVEYALLNEDGSINDWTDTGDLGGSSTDDRAFGQLEVAGGSLYFIGGQNDSATPQSTIYYTTPNSNGTITSWSTASGGIGDTNSQSAVARSQLSAAVWNDRIYITGGLDSSLATTSTVYYSPQLSSGGNIAADSWSSATSFNVARSYHATIAYSNNLYILGGYTGTTPLSDVQYTQINSDGTLDSWTYSTSLPRRVRGIDGFAANGYMYIVGGKEEDISCNNNTFVAPISANTSVSSGDNPTGVGEWFVTNEKFNAERAGASVTYSKGKAYVLGGACGEVQTTGTSTVMTDDFDANIDATMWTSTSNTTASTACGTVASGNALKSSGNNNAIAVSKDVDVLYGGTVSFYLKIPTSTVTGCDAPEGGEDLELQYSKNSGSSWTTLATYNESSYNTPTLITESVPVAARSSTTRFRWLIPLADNNQDMWAIDNVEIIKNTVPPLTEIMEDNFDANIDAADWISTTGMSVGTTCNTVGSNNNLRSTGGTSNAVTQDLDMRSGGLVTFTIRVPSTSAGGCTQPAADEVVELQYSTNSGGAWTTIASFDKATYDPSQVVNQVIPAGAQTSATRFRWIMPLGDAAADIWAIDDVSIKVFQSVLTYAGSNRVVTTTLLSQPQVAKYSRMIDTDTDVFPTNWLLNGVDNSIGALWQMNYRSMHDIADGASQQNPDEDCGTSSSMATMTTWGQDTSFGDVSLEKIEEYTAKNSSGSNINCARYYYFLVTIDASQAYGYPEDIDRGPTITDLTLFFTSDPSKRLRHGKTFTGGEKQPLDTPCRAPANPLTDPNRNNCVLDE